MEKLFHKINKYSYKLGNSIENNDIQKIDTYTKHHIHHFEQCGKAIIQSGGNMDEIRALLGVYIDSVNELVEIYNIKLHDIHFLNQQKDIIDKKIQDIYDKQDPLITEADAKEATIKELKAELELLKSRRVLASSVGGSIKNNNKINGAKHDMHYIQQYGKAIIQSGGTIKELKVNLEGYIVAVALFLDKYNIMMQEHYAVNAAVQKGNEDVLKVQPTLDELSTSNAIAQQVIDQLHFQIDALKGELESNKVSIKSLVDTMCDKDMVTDKEGGCHKSLQQIDKVLRAEFKKSKEALILGYDGGDIIKFYRSIKNNNKDAFIGLLKNNRDYTKRGTLLQLIGIPNIKVILGDVKVNVRDELVNISDERFNNANFLLTNNDEAIKAIADFFYEKPIIPLLPE